MLARSYTKDCIQTLYTQKMHRNMYGNDLHRFQVMLPSGEEVKEGAKERDTGCFYFSCNIFLSKQIWLSKANHLWHMIEILGDGSRVRSLWTWLAMCEIFIKVYPEINEKNVVALPVSPWRSKRTEQAGRRRLPTAETRSRLKQRAS